MSVATVHYYGSVTYDEPELEGPLAVNPNAEMDRPDWRWVLAGQLRQSYSDGVSLADDRRWQPCRTVDMLVAERVLPFLYQYNRITSYDQGKRLEGENPGLYWAVKVFETDPLLRYRLEAMFLGKATNAEIATAIRTPENYVWWYEKMFFDARSHLDDLPWLDSKVFAVALRECPHHLYRQGILWKIIAYVFGWEQFVNNSSYFTPTNGAVNDVVHRLINDRNYENALIVAMTRPINRFSYNSIMEENLRKEEIALRRAAMEREGDISDEQKTFAAFIAPVIAEYSKVTGREDMHTVPEIPAGLETIFIDREHERVLLAETQKKAEEEGVFSDGDYY